MLMMIFHIGNNLYAIESDRVVEVIPRVFYRQIPHAPTHIAGVFNYRGKIVPVIDLCQLIRESSSLNHLSTRVMMVSYPSPDGTLQYVGLMAERVIEALEKSPEEFQDLSFKPQASAYLGGIITDKRGLIQQLCLEPLLMDVQQLQQIEVGV